MGLHSTHFVPDLCSCVKGVYDAYVENAGIINTVLLLVQKYNMS